MRLSVLLFAALLASGMKPPRAGAEPPLASFAERVVPPGPLARFLGPARALAVERLGTEACRAMFEELHDFTGRPAARRLADGERSPSSHFVRLRFVERRDGPCAQGGRVAAWSSPGDPLVRVCPRVFAAVAGQDRGEAAAILIHEALHTLGVGEDAAKQPLTDYVRSHCGL
jgi:hypothetical protein